HELGLGLAQPYQAVARARVEARVLEGERGLVGERLERLQLLARERAARVGAEREGADNAIVREQRHANDGAIAAPAYAVAYPGRELNGRVGQDVSADDDAAIANGAAHGAFARLEDQLAHRVGVHAVGGHRAQRAVLGLEQEDTGGARVHQLAGAAREQLGDRLYFQGGSELAGQPRQHLGHVAPALGLAVEARVLDG